MPDCDVTPERIEHGLVEDLRHQAHVLEHDDPAAVADGDPGRLLAAMLQGVQAEVGELGHLLARRPDAEDPAGILRRPLIGVEIIREAAIGLDHLRSLWQEFPVVPVRALCEVGTTRNGAPG